jgi:hypothetical protein
MSLYTVIESQHLFRPRGLFLPAAGPANIAKTNMGFMSDAGEVRFGLSRVHDVGTSNLAGPPPSPIVPRLALGGVLFHTDGTENAA